MSLCSQSVFPEMSWHNVYLCYFQRCFISFRSELIQNLIMEINISSYPKTSKTGKKSHLRPLNLLNPGGCSHTISGLVYWGNHPLHRAPELQLLTRTTCRPEMLSHSPPSPLANQNGRIVRTASGLELLSGSGSHGQHTQPSGSECYREKALV